MSGSERAPRQSAFLVGLKTTPAGAAAAANGRSGSLAGSAPEPAQWDVEQCLEELARLADSAGLRVVGRTWQRRSQPDPRTYLGGGKLAEVAATAHTLGADVVLFDDELTPSQLRNVERSLGDELPVVDRTALILDIFARHARSREGPAPGRAGATRVPPAAAHPAMDAPGTTGGRSRRYGRGAAWPG